jgi:hypothetical protein
VAHFCLVGIFSFVWATVLSGAERGRAAYRRFAIPTHPDSHGRRRRGAMAAALRDKPRRPKRLTRDTAIRDGRYVSRWWLPSVMRRSVSRTAKDRLLRWTSFRRADHHAAMRFLWPYLLTYSLSRNTKDGLIFKPISSRIASRPSDREAVHFGHLGLALDSNLREATQRA